MTHYQKGVRLEREVIQLFKENGYTAFRTAGSHSPFDVVLVKTTEENKKICFVAFVQCKVSKLRSNKTGDTWPDSQRHSPEQLPKLLSKN